MEEAFGSAALCPRTVTCFSIRSLAPSHRKASQAMCRWASMTQPSGETAEIAQVREPYCNKLVIDNVNSINAAKLPFRDRSILVKDTGHRPGTSKRKLLQAGFGELKTEAGPVR